MALTLVEAAKLSNDIVLAGIIETIVKESQLLNYLPFAGIVGNALTYNRENAAATAAFYSVGDTWAESTPTFTQVTASLVILGGDADVDNYIKQTRSNVQDIEAAILELKAKAVAHKFEDTFIYGSATADTKSFSGLHITIPSGQRVAAGSSATAGVLTLAKMDQLIDLIIPGKPDLLMMSRRTRRGLSKYARSLTSPVSYEPTEFGKRVMMYDGIPVAISDFIGDVETIASSTYSAKTGGSSSSVFALKFGEGAVIGIDNGGIQKERIGSLETKDATRTRVKWYVNGLVCYSTLAIACIDGISSGDVTA